MSSLKNDILARTYEARLLASEVRICSVRFCVWSKPESNV